MASNEGCQAGSVPFSTGLASASVLEDNPFAMRGVESFDILPLKGGGIREVHAAHLLARLKDAIGAPVRGCAAPGIDQFPPVIPRPPPPVHGPTHNFPQPIEMVSQTLTED